MEYDQHEYQHEYVYQHVNKYNQYKFKYVYVDLDINEYDDDGIILWQEHIFTSCEENDGS